MAVSYFWYNRDEMKHKYILGIIEKYTDDGKKIITTSKCGQVNTYNILRSSYQVDTFIV